MEHIIIIIVLEDTIARKKKKQWKLNDVVTRVYSDLNCVHL